MIKLKCPNCLKIDPPYTQEKRANGFSTCHACGAKTVSVSWIEIGEKAIIVKAFAVIPGDVSDPIDITSFEDKDLVIFDSFDKVSRWAAKTAKEEQKPYRVVEISEVGIFYP